MYPTYTKLWPNVTKQITNSTKLYKTFVFNKSLTKALHNLTTLYTTLHNWNFTFTKLDKSREKILHTHYKIFKTIKLYQTVHKLYTILERFYRTLKFLQNFTDHLQNSTKLYKTLQKLYTTLQHYTTLRTTSQTLQHST